MKLIVGLGNPGKKYERTRHNVGFRVIDSLLERDRNRLVSGRRLFQVSQNPFQNGAAALAKPAVFMNESGQAVRALLDEFRVTPPECLIVVDDVNLPLGSMRFRARGSAGGHHGLESIASETGTMDFPRLRIGVGTGGESGNDLTEFVLGNSPKEEEKIIAREIERASRACLDWLQGNDALVMRRYN